MVNEKQMRKIKSFVRRDGRLTEAQRDAMEKGWPQFGIELQSDATMLDFANLFHREAPRVLEIGFGSGQSLLEAATEHPDHDFIGIETHKPGIGSLLQHIQLRSLQNLRIIYADAVQTLETVIKDQQFDIIQIFFPDPWPKRKHHKRRLIQTEFVQLLTQKMKIGGTLHIATDWEDYAKHIIKVLSSAPLLQNVFGEGSTATRSAQRPLITKFEQRGLKEGRKIWEFQFIRVCRAD